MRTVLLAGAALLGLAGAAHAADGNQWWSFDTEAKACLNDTTPQQQVGIFKDHDINDVTLSYVKTERGEVMYAKIRATDNGDFLNYVTFFHSYHKGGKLVTGKKSCEDVQASKPQQ
jgi:hypothetical protein